MPRRRAWTSAVTPETNREGGRLVGGPGGCDVGFKGKSHEPGVTKEPHSHEGFLR